MVIENFCGDRYLWDPCVLVQFRTAIKPMVISIFPPEMVERLREHKTKFDSVRGELAATSEPTVNTKKHTRMVLGFLKIENQKKITGLSEALGRLSIYGAGLQHRADFVTEGWSKESHSCFLSLFLYQLLWERCRPAVQSSRKLWQSWVTSCSCSLSTSVYQLPTMCQAMYQELKM